MARLSNAERIAKLETKIAKLEAEIEEQERYKVLIAQGNRGSETHFTDIDVLYKRLETLESQLATLYMAEGL